MHFSSLVCAPLQLRKPAVQQHIAALLLTVGKAVPVDTDAKAAIFLRDLEVGVA